jgi:hypothetical protein
MQFAAPFDQLVPTIIGLYKQKIDLHQKLIDICTAMIGGPKTWRGLRQDGRGHAEDKGIFGQHGRNAVSG